MAGVLLYMNPASDRLLEELHLQVGQHVPPSLRDFVQQTLLTGRSEKVEHDIASCHYLISVTPIVKEHYANLYWTDITERKLAEEVLHNKDVELKEEAATLARLNELSSRLWKKRTLDQGLDEMLDATIELLGADKGNIQVLNERRVLVIAAQKGFDQDFLDFFAEVSTKDDCACGRALRSGSRMFIEDVDSDALYAPLREVARSAGYRAVQSTPLLGRNGEPLGMLSTHWRTPHRPTEQAWRRLDLYVRQAADFIERSQSDEALRLMTIELDNRVAIRTQELRQSEGRLRALTTELNLAEQRERKRLAEELHDHLQQMLVLGKMRVAQGKQASPSSSNLMKQLDEIFSEALKYTRTLVAELSPPVLQEHGLTGALKWLAEYMQKYEMVVSVSVPDHIHLHLPEAQKVLLFQSVRELLINSSKHSGSPEAWVTIEQREGVLEVKVRDNGIGFDLATTADVAPSGDLSSKFGLFSIRERMKALGGSFHIQSSPNRGTVATLTLPLTVTEAESRMFTGDLAHQNGFEHIENSVPKISVLLVDDHAMVRQGLRAVLEAYDDLAVIGEAWNGEEALAAVQQFRPQVVIMDLNMPKKNGIEATAAIKARHPEIIVIGLSISSSKDNEKAMLNAGAATVLNKESDVEYLYNAIRQAVKTHHVLPSVESPIPQ
jgi:signal transduction histidine kinase/CheY-like chemotaxis protein